MKTAVPSITNATYVKIPHLTESTVSHLILNNKGNQILKNTHFGLKTFAHYTLIPHSLHNETPLATTPYPLISHVFSAILCHQSLKKNLHIYIKVILNCPLLLHI